MRSLTILQIAYPFARVGPDAVGGAEQVLASLDAAWAQRGHESLVIAAAGSRVHGELLALPAPPASVDDEARSATYAALRELLGRTLLQRRIDVVHLHGVDFWHYSPQTGPPLLATLHLASDAYPSNALTEPRPGLQLSCVSRTQQAGCPPGMRRPIVIDNGVDVASFTPRFRAGEYAVCLGRICPEKGYHLALDAARRARLRLLLAGAVHPYELHRRYFHQEIAPRLGAGNTFIGPVDRVQRNVLLAHARCLIVPSLVAETSSLVAMEALSCGTPVIALDRGALSEIVTHGRTGFLLREHAELTPALDAAGSLDRRECRREAETRFSAERMHDAYLALYRALMAGTALEAV